MKYLFFCISFLSFYQVPFAQLKRENIYSEFVLYPKRAALEKDLRGRLIPKTFSLPIDENTEYKYASACDAITQFLFDNADVEKGFRKLAAHYDGLDYDVKKSFLVALYAASPNAFKEKVQDILYKENDPLLFSICAAYLFRCDSSVNNANLIKIKMTEQFPSYDSLTILNELEKYLSYHNAFLKQARPDLLELFSYEKTTGQKIIYSFQRYNRDYPGLAVVQNADGSFVKSADGKLLVFEQLARSGSDLPYFIPNGSTPQGIYSIQGTNSSRNNFIGPTPTLQLLMPFENKWTKYFLQIGEDGQDSLTRYKKLFPLGWREYEPMMEAWYAGKIGRNSIIAHGSAIDPEYFKGKPFYPLTPSEGCLTAKEQWNVTTGKLLMSEQFNLVSAFHSTPGNKGLLYVINLDNQQKAVSRPEVELLVKKFENKK